ncbi:MAG: signal peptidase I [Planctomycetota bacterium]|jgi:signal peptidase I
MGEAADTPAVAGAPVDPEAPAKKPASAESWLRDNLEAVAVAIVMALLIRHFCVEAFRIPTSSMEPTLYGVKPERSGDRILVNKVGYFFTEPTRWDVCVFKYPLNRSRNYIKRVVGLPGDQLDIRGGDIWVREEIQRKPARVQDALWQDVFELQRAAAGALEQRYRSGGDGSGAADDGRAMVDLMDFRDANAVLQFDGQALVVTAKEFAEPAWVILPDKNGAGEYLARDDRMNEVGDLRVRAAVTPGADADAEGALWLRVGPLDSRFKLRLPLAGGALEVQYSTEFDDETTPVAGAAEVVLPALAGRTTQVEAAHLDGTVTLALDGVEVWRYEYLPPAAAHDIARWDGTPALGFEGFNGRIHALAADRDIHYLRESPDRLPYDIPAGHYLMLGDNSAHSKDGRLWAEVEFTLADGRVIRGDGDRSARGDDGLQQFVHDTVNRRLELVDDTGYRWVLPAEEVQNFDAPREAPAPFVPAENLVGRAFFIFFPFGRVSFLR